MTTNICKTGEYNTAFYFHSVCDCTSADHSQCLAVEIDEDGYGISCRIYQDLFWADWNLREAPFYKRWWTRLCHAVTYLFIGHVRVSGEHILMKEDHIRDYANALLGSIDELKQRRMSYLQANARRGKRGPTPSSTEDVQGQGDSGAPQDLPS